MDQRLRQRLDHLARARREVARYKALKQALHEEVDAQKASKEVERLAAELQHLQAGETALAERLSYGLPPGWGSGGSAGSSAAGSAFAWFEEWHSGTEVVYSTRRAAEGEGGRLEVALEQREVELQVGAKPFAHGGLRRAFYARDKGGGRFVLKRPLLESSKPKKRLAELHCDAAAAALSAAAAQAFNAAAAGAGCGRVEYLAASVVVLRDGRGPGGRTAYLKEPWLDCGGRPFTKWTRNDGHLFPEGVSDATIQAFTHHSLRFMQQEAGCQAIVLDAQGMAQAAEDSSGGGTLRYTLTDPALCSKGQQYGESDSGEPAIAAFLAAHTCGEACGACGAAGACL